MKENNYFDYDGNISTYYTPFDSLNIFPKKKAPAEPVCEVIDENVKTAGESETEKSGNKIAEPAKKDKDKIEKSDKDEQESESTVSPEELAEAIKAFEELELPEEKEEVQSEEKGESISENKEKEAKKKEGTEEPGDKEAENKEKTKIPPVEYEPFFEKVKKAAKKVSISVKRKEKDIEEKEVSPLKRFLVTLIMLLLVIAIFAGVVYIFMSSINKENKEANEFNKNAAKICTSYSVKYGSANYENLYDLYKIQGYRLTGLCFVRELDFDDDGKSELMLTYNKNGKYCNEVWGDGDKGEFKTLYSASSAQTDSKADDAYSILYHSNNKYYIARFDGTDNDKFSLMSLKHGKFVKKYDGEYDDKTRSYSVDGKDDTNAFERIKYSVLKEEKASAEAEQTASLIDSFTGGEEIEAADRKQTLEKAYYQVVSDYNKKYGISRYREDHGTAYIDGLADVELIDFDGDGKNELFLVYRKPVKERSQTASGKQVTIEVDKYYCDIYRYNSNKAALVYSNEGLSNKLDGGADVYYMIKSSGKKSYYCLNHFSNTDYGQHISAVSAQYEYKKGEFVSLYKASYTTDYGYSRYYLDGQKVDKYQFNIEGYKNPFFDGEDDFKNKNFTVIYLQRSTADSDDIKNIPSSTEKTIQSLNQLYSAK